MDTCRCLRLTKKLGDKQRGRAIAMHSTGLPVCRSHVLSSKCLRARVRVCISFCRISLFTSVLNTRALTYSTSMRFNVKT
jgi:hypothetical protein